MFDNFNIVIRIDCPHPIYVVQLFCNILVVLKALSHKGSSINYVRCLGGLGSVGGGLENPM